MLSRHLKTFAGKQVWLELDTFFFLIHIAYNHFKEVVNVKSLKNLKKASGLHVCARAHVSERKYHCNCVANI